MDIEYDIPQIKRIELIKFPELYKSQDDISLIPENFKIINSSKEERLELEESFKIEFKEEEEEEEEEEESKYCSKILKKELFFQKSKLDKIDRRLLRKARSLINPFEEIKSGIFQNRAAVKLSNLDYLFNLIPVFGKISFADVCGGPGGFTEYIFWKKKNLAYGFGITLKGREGVPDWRLDRFTEEAPTNNFEIHYGIDNTGDIMKRENIEHFQKQIYKKYPKGVDIVVSDGGFSVEGQFNKQEQLLQRLILCQFLVMFHILKKGGCFICKVFDLFTPFSFEICYILYRFFNKFSIIKPYTSRPANSEKYIIGIDLKEHYPKDIIERMFLCNIKKNPYHILQLLKSEDTGKFLNHFKNWNDFFIKNQIDYLKLLQSRINEKFSIFDQYQISITCLNRWGLFNNSNINSRIEIESFQSRKRKRRKLKKRTVIKPQTNFYQNEIIKKKKTESNLINLISNPDYVKKLYENQGVK